MATNFINDGDQFNGAVPASVVSGDPTLYGSILPVVAITDRDTAGLATVRSRGVFDLSVKGADDAGNSAVAVGDRIYWTTGDTPKLNKKISGALFGIAEEVVTSGATATIRVRLAGLAGAGENALAAHIADPAAHAALTAANPAALTAPAAGVGAGANSTTFSGAQCDAVVADLAVLRTQILALVADGVAAKAGVDANNAAIDSVLAALDNRVTASA